MEDPGLRARPGSSMVFSVADFGPPRRGDEGEGEVFIHAVDQARRVSATLSPENADPVVEHTAESFQRPRSYMDHEYPEWLDDLPPWRNPHPSGGTYLYVWQQHQARIRGHH